MKATLNDIIDIMEKIAPLYLAKNWDNSGLQIGQREREISNIIVALDPTPEVVNSACMEKADLLIVHHPLFFKPMASLNFSTPVGALINKAVCNNLAIFAAHTNLDCVKNGVNDILAHKIGLKNLKVLCPSMESELYKLVINVPVEYEQPLLNAIFETNAGVIGTYTNCTFRNKGKGTFKPGDLSNPFAGDKDKISDVDEIRIETLVKKGDLNNIINHAKKKHPYETMGYDVYPVLDSQNCHGLGRVGYLEEKTSLVSFASDIKKKFNIKNVKVSGDPEMVVSCVAVCSGSGSGLMKDFFSSEAQVYISGDLRYHDARDAENSHRGLIDIGHFLSEYLIVDVLVKRLKEILSKMSFDVKVKACKLEDDPFWTI